MSDLRVAATTETARVTPAGAEGKRRRREPAPRKDRVRRAAAGAPRQQLLAQAGRDPLRVQWDIAEDGELRIRLVAAHGRTIGEVTPEELLARVGGASHGTGLLLQATK
jgi:hypothetical protein